MKIHFIAIGGSAMHNLAIALHKKGFQITGSDDAIFEPSKTRLEKYDLLPEKTGWFDGKVTENLDAVILGMHAKLDNPELQKAQKLGLKIYSYPEFLYEQSKHKTRVVIGGSHGKTTITAMILHILKFCKIKVDYMVGAQLEGFETMVHLTDENEFIVLEGDEYLASPIDLRSKFHLYKPNIALLSGISWDHINVFPTFENYKEQFEIFLNSLTNGGILVYNQEDETVLKMVEKNTNPIKKYPYQTPLHKIENGETFLETLEGDLPLEIFGKHNLQNLAGAKQICMQMGVLEEDFYQGIASFTGADKRLEKIFQNEKTTIFKDFAHAPSKVKATLEAVKKQYLNHKITACLELHTYSSLNEDFISEYQGIMDDADETIVFFNLETMQQKKMKILTEEQIQNAFQKSDLQIFKNSENFQNFIFSQNWENKILLLMSSGNYGGFDFEKLKTQIL